MLFKNGDVVRLKCSKDTLIIKGVDYDIHNKEYVYFCYLESGNSYFVYRGDELCLYQ